ncbi:MAG TPA: hypothetical protein VF658_04885 [Pyrinomonadaceae bacterium]|jgi:hypothetical protein
MSAQLSIQRLNALYLVPRELPEADAGAARSVLDAVMRRRLAEMCGQLMTHVLSENDPSVWLIRRLDLDLALDVGVVDEERLSRAWASRIAASLARVIARGPDGESVMRFPDRAAYLAHFLRDMAEGRAWEKWQYDSLATLRNLPSSAGMREALLREPEQTENTLLYLARRGWLEQMLVVMTEGDVLRVYEACTGTRAFVDSVDEERKIIDSLLNVWHAAPVRAASSGIANAPNALRLYLALRLKSPETSARGSLRSVIYHLLGFAEILRRINEPEELLLSLMRGKLAKAIEQAHGGGMTLHLESLPFIQRTANGNQAWLAKLAQAVSLNVPAVVLDEKEEKPRILNSACGGLFLLMPAMLDLNLHGLIEATPYPASEEANKERWLRYLLFLKICRARSVDAAYDFVPRFLAGLDELPSFADLQDFSQSATAKMNQAVLWLLLEELARRGRVDGNYLAAELIAREKAGGSDEVLLLRDIVSDTWVYAAHVIDDAATLRASLERGLKTVRQATGNAPACLLVEKNLASRLETETLGGQLAEMIPDERMRALLSASQPNEEEMAHVWISEAVELTEHLSETLCQYLSRRRPAAAELAYFSLTDADPAFITDEGFDLVWSLVARALMKEFAARLVNFGWSSAEYLSRNFLEGMSTVQVESGRIDVRLARSPLHILLRIAGMDEQSYTIPWLNDTQVTLSLMPE